MNTLPLLIICGTIGILLGLLRRRKQMRRGEGIIAIAANDYVFSKYATIPYLSFIYAVYQGAALGLSLGTLLLGVNGFMSNVLKASIFCPVEYSYGCDVGYEYLWIPISLIASILVVRISIEGYIVLFKVAQVFIDNHGEGSRNR